MKQSVGLWFKVERNRFMNKKFNHRWMYFCMAALFAFYFMAVLTNVPTRLQPEDKLAIKTILGRQQPPEIRSFEDEIRVLRWAQDQVMRAAPGMTPIPEFMEREPMDLLKAQSGLCYDRSRTLDKVYKWLGFESRHVYILFADSGVETSPWQFLRYVFSRSKSHAVTEVKTSRGWLMVDSNSPWISLNSNMMPVPADQVHVRKLEFQHPPPFVELPFWAIRGMYSRKGQFYRPFVFFPEFNWPDFLSWVGSS